MIVGLAGASTSCQAVTLAGRCPEIIDTSRQLNTTNHYRDTDYARLKQARNDQYRVERC